MAERLRLRVTRVNRWRLPLVSAKFDGVYVAPLVVSSGEPYTSLAGPLAHDLRGEDLGRGRRVVPSDAGSAIVPIIRLRRFELLSVDGRWLDFGAPTMPVTFRPQAIGVGGLLGLDVLARFSRIVFEVGPPDVLMLERG